MIQLEKERYCRIESIVRNSAHELTIDAVIAGNNPGAVFVDSAENPRSVLIRTAECNMVAGSPGDESFLSDVRGELDFWDQVICDSEAWERAVPRFHPNPYVKKYRRKYYRLHDFRCTNYHDRLPADMRIERISASLLSGGRLRNADRVAEWIGKNWLDTDHFLRHGIGFSVRNDRDIVSWCLTDCYSDRGIEMGVFTDEDHRGKGLGSIAVAATVEACLASGVERIGWHCVGTNRGSIAVAEKVGFTHVLDYDCYTPYPPIENEDDLSEREWAAEASYYSSVCGEEPRYSWLALECWAKAGDVEKALLHIDEIIRSGITMNERFREYLSCNPAFRKLRRQRRWTAFLETMENAT